MKKITVAIYGVTGYAGELILKLLSVRKEVKIIHTPDRKIIGEEIKKEEHVPQGIKIAFLALPEEISMFIAPLLLKRGIKVIDLSGAYRLKKLSLYKKFYNLDHLHPRLLGKAIYGLPEKNRRLIKNASFVASGGCYATAANLALMPLVAAGFISAATKIRVEAISGYTGAGKKAEIPLNIESYKDKNGREHRHIPEIEQELGLKEQLFFYPKKAPWPRGIEMQIVIKSKTKIPLIKLYESFYGKEPFVKIRRETKEKLINTNFCFLWPRYENSSIVIEAVIDNLMKGAAGQAIQNMNLMFGLAEEEELL
jgi:N-acetyl-gamma-glutamyl-phosphate reductase